MGKSTLFNALTQAEIPAENYPFCTIEPNVGIVPVPDPRLNELAAIVKPQKILPTTMEFVDIAGLVAGASKGEGLGNQFLAHIRETDAIAHIIRCFEDGDVVHVDGHIDPLSDLETIDTELILADLETAERALEKSQRQSKSGDKEAIAKMRLLTKVCQHLGQGLALRNMELASNERDLLRTYQFISRKPVMYVANVSEDGFEGNQLLDRLKQQAASSGIPVVTVCAAIEAEIAQLDAQDRQAFLEDLGMEQSGLDRMIHAGYRLLELLTFFTAGEKEVRAWTVSRGSTAPQAAGRIHTDFERGFIRAEVTAFDDYMACGGEQGAKDAGKLRLEGKGYVVKEGDVMHFRFNV